MLASSPELASPQRNSSRHCNLPSPAALPTPGLRAATLQQPGQARSQPLELQTTASLRAHLLSELFI